MAGLLARTWRRLEERLDRFLYGKAWDTITQKKLDFDEVLAEMTRTIEISSRKLVNDVLAGDYHSAFKGRGMEFAEVREYFPGDDIRDIDWNVTARMQAPFVKVYTEEREMTVILMVDASASGDFGSIKETKRIEAARVCAMLAFAAIANQDRVGLVIFTDRVEQFIPPKKGKKHVLRIIREVLSHEPQHQGTNISDAIDHLNRVQRRKALVFLVSDFLDKGFEDPLRVAAKRYDMVAIGISDPLERTIAATGAIDFEDFETGQILSFDAASPESIKAFEGNARRHQEQLDIFFKRNKIDYVSLECGKAIDLPLIRFFQGRLRRLGG